MNPDVSVAIGIPLHGAPLAERTVVALRATAPQAQLVLLETRPRDTTANQEGPTPIDAVGDPGDLPRIVSDRPDGNAACFNSLVRSVHVDVYVLFENGAVPAAGWLNRLLDTFIRVPRCGIAGPSTNRCWNEQAIIPAGSECPTAPDLALSARAVERRFGSSRRSLSPLHSVADFCYAVRREVVETIGDADENYPNGNCWEMDYNIRAHRAGFLGVWTRAAYVERAPLHPPNSMPGDPQQLIAGKHRYQDKFCGARLRGKKTDYREHCRGDACPNFAPSGLIQVHLDRDLPPALKSAGDSVAAHALLDSRQIHPLVSCIMPTYNRRAFLPAALACFAAQDYPNLELIVVDDGSDSIADLLPADPRIRYFRLKDKLPTGTKRNFACEQAHGAYIAHWDDDDWYPPSRVRTQIDAMRGTHWQVSGSTTMYYIHSDLEQAFRYTYRGSGRAWLGAMLYAKAAWERHRFDEIQVGEDVRFLARIPFADRLDLFDPALNIGSIHASNTSPKATGGPYWSAEPHGKICDLMRPREAPVPAAPALPLISCIMPTHNRRAFIGLALACFDAQTYSRRELVVVDDGTDPVGDLLEGRPGIRYARISTRMTLGAKRNLACEIAQGELIAHWDDDDWYNPRRLSEQIAPLLAQQCDVTGLVTTHVLEMPFARFWTLSGDLHGRMFMGDVVGGTLMFSKSLLHQGIRYPEMNLAEDAALIRQFTQRRKRVKRIAEPGLFVYVRHGRNTWLFDPGRFVDPRGWSVTVPPPEFPAAALDSYRAACLQASLL